MTHHRVTRLVGTLAAAALLLGMTGCTKLRARDQLNKGVQEYKANHFERAIEHFKNASSLDPSLNVAKLYLATACATQYVPGGDNAENVRMAECALDNFKQVLDSKPDKQQQVLSAKGIASLYLNMKKFDEAKEWNKRAIELDPTDADNYYSVAVIDWTQSYLDDNARRQELGIATKPNEPIKDKKVCAELKEKHGDKVQEGIDMLNKALEQRKDYDDAMAYLNLLYRQRADQHCPDIDTAMADLKAADEWVEKSMATKKAKAAKASEQHGIVLDQPQGK